MVIDLQYIDQEMQEIFMTVSLVISDAASYNVPAFFVEWLCSLAVFALNFCCAAEPLTLQEENNYERI